MTNQYYCSKAPTRPRIFEENAQGALALLAYKTISGTSKINQVHGSEADENQIFLRSGAMVFSQNRAQPLIFLLTFFIKEKSKARAASTKAKNNYDCLSVPRLFKKVCQV